MSRWSKPLDSPISALIASGLLRRRRFRPRCSRVVSKTLTMVHSWLGNWHRTTTLTGYCFPSLDCAFSCPENCGLGCRFNHSVARRSNLKRKTLMPLPDGPKSPKIWQMLHWITMPFSFMQACNDRYGDCFTAGIGEKLSPVVFFSNPQALQVILTNDDSEFFDSPGELNAPFEPLLGTQSVIGLSGDRHRRMRQLLMPPFHGERMRSYGQLILKITEEVMSQRVGGKTFSVRQSMQRISMRVILRAVFGLNEGTRYQRLERLLAAMLDRMSNPLSVSLLYLPVLRQDFGPLSPWGDFVRIRQQVDQLIYDEIAGRRCHPDASRNDILTLLMSARDEAGEPLTDAELRDELMTLLLAGHET